MSDLQRHLEGLKSLEENPEILLTSSLTLFQELLHNLDQSIFEDESMSQQYFRFLMECYKIIDKSILNPGFLQALITSSRGNLASHLIKHFMIVWTKTVRGYDNILTLKLWMSLIQKFNSLKNAQEFLWFSKVGLETFYPEILYKDQRVALDFDELSNSLSADCTRDLKASNNFVTKLKESRDLLYFNQNSLNFDSFRILINSIILRASTLTISENIFSFASVSEWNLLLWCYQVLWKMYREDPTRMAELFKIYFKDCFKMVYKFSGMALEKGLIDSRDHWRIRNENFENVIETKAMDFNDLGNYLIDTINKMTKNNGASRAQIVSLCQIVTRALLVHGKRVFQAKNILSFYYKILTYYEESYDSEQFYSVISLLISPDDLNIPENVLLSIEFWHQNLNKSHYLPAIISFVLTKLLKLCDGKEEFHIDLLFRDEINFCFKGLQILLRLKILQEGPGKNKDQDFQIESMISKLTKVYNHVEKLKMSILNAFLNRRFILAKLEGQFSAEEHVVERIIRKIRENPGFNSISDLLEIQPRLYRILIIKESSNPNRALSVSVNNKFYNLLYLIVCRSFDAALVNFVIFKKALQEYLATIFVNREGFDDPNFLKEIQSSVNYLSKVLESTSNPNKANVDEELQENVSLIENVVLAINDLCLFRRFDMRSILNISNNLCKSLKHSISRPNLVIQCLFKLYKAIFDALEGQMEFYKTQSLDEKDNMYKLFEMLVRTEVTMIRVGLFIPELSEILSTGMELESVSAPQNQILRQLSSFVWKVESRRAKKILMKARIRVLTSLFGEDSVSSEEISNLYYLIENDLHESIEKAQDLKAIKSQILWLEVLYIFASNKQEMQNKDMDMKVFEQALWRLCKQFEFARNLKDVASLKQEEILLKILREGISKKLKDITPVLSPGKQFKYHLINADLSRKTIYLLVYTGLQEDDENLKIEETARNTSLILHEFRNSIGAFYSMLNLEAPEKDFRDYMNMWIRRKSDVRACIAKVLNDMKISDAIRVQKLLSSYVEIAEYLCLSDEVENLLKIIIAYWICFGHQFNKGLDKKTSALFNTRTQLMLAIMQIKLAIVYQKKLNFESSEKCYQNFTNYYNKDSVEKVFKFLEKDPEYQAFLMELKGLRFHLESLVHEYQIQTNQSGAFENFKQFLQKLEKDAKLDKLKSSYAFMFLKINLLLHSGQTLYSNGHPAYSIQEIRKCLDYLINYGFNYNQSQGIDQILAKQMDAKPDRFARVCLLDLKYLNETNQLTKELLRPAGSSSLEAGSSMNTVANILNTLFPKNLALNYSKLSMLGLITKSIKKLAKISYNIGLLYYSEYYVNILKTYVLKTSQVLSYIKIMTKENNKKEENDAPSLLQKDDRFIEINKVNDVINTLASPPGYNIKTLPNLKKTFSWNQRLFDKMHEELSKTNYVDGFWINTLTKYMRSTIILYSSHNEKNNNESQTRIAGARIANASFNACHILKDFMKTGKFAGSKMLAKDWYKHNHLQSKIKSFEFWSFLIKLIDAGMGNLSKKLEEGYTFEMMIWLLNCSQIVRHIIYKNSFLHSPLTKQALILKQNLVSWIKKHLSTIFESQDFGFLKELAKVTQLGCSCGQASGGGAEIEQSVQSFGDSFNKEIDFWLTYSDVVFTYKHQIKNIRKVMKSKGDKRTERDELKYIRKSLKTLKLGGDEADNNGDIKFISNLKDEAERNFEEYSVKSAGLVQNISKFLGETPILILKFVKKRKQKMLFIAKVFKDPKKNFSFIIDDHFKTNYLNDLLLDFSKIISNIEKDLVETSRAQTGEKDKGNLNVSDWWKERFALDKRMETLLKALEDTIGFYKGIMLGDLKDENLNSTIEESYKTLELMILKYVENNLGAGLYSSLLKELRRDAYSYTEMLKGASVLSILERSSEVQFKLTLDEINENGLCFKILSQSQQSEFKSIILEYRSKLFKCFEGKDLKRKPAVLLLDEHFQFLPFECMPLFLSQNQGFLRIPSFEYIRSLQHEASYVNLKDTFYVLNPSKDLKRTQEKFQEFLQRKQGWQGIIGSEPSKSLLKQALTQNDCYLYIGHGAGEKYFNEGELKEIMKIKSAVLLIGCSSAKQIKSQNYISKGEAELAGISIEYLLCNCPFLVGNLWDVTDKDMDAMTEHILEAATTPNSVTDILDLIQQARNQCKMKYLNGSALVCYGVPLGFIY